MKEDITILTAFLLSNIPEIITQEEFDEVKQAIENLIKGYRDGEDILKNITKENLELKEYIRELEKENKELKEYIVVVPNLDEMTAVKYSHIQREAYVKGRAEEQQKAEQIIYEHYIPKSKVKKQIEVLESFKGLKIYEENNFEGVINLLKELMEE